MKGVNERDKFSQHHQIFNSSNGSNVNVNNVVVSPTSSSISSYDATTNGFCFPDVGSSSMVPPSFDHHNHISQFSTASSHFVDQFFVGSSVSDDSWCKGGALMDDGLGLAREFQKMDVGSHNNNNNRVFDYGRFGKDSDGFCNVANVRPFNGGENFGCHDGFVNGVSGSSNGGFSMSAPVRSVGKDVGGLRLGKRVSGGGNFGDSVGSNSPYGGGVVGQGNCLINYPSLDETTHQGHEYYGNLVPVMRGNKACGGERVALYDGGSEYLGNGGGVVQRGNGGGYGSELPLQMQPAYGPHVVDDSLQQYIMEGCKEVLSSWASSQTFPVYKPYGNEALLQQYGGQYCGIVGGLNSMDYSDRGYSKQALSRGNVLYNSMREKMRAAEREGSPPVGLMRKVRQPYGGENTLILKGKGSNGSIGHSFQSSGRRKSLLSGSTTPTIGERSFDLNGSLARDRSGGMGSPVASYDPLVLETLYKTLEEAKGNIYFMAKDQHGCRFLQKKFDEGLFEDVQLIFNEIIDHVVELMVNPFGNYLVQKLLDVCNEDQRIKIVHVVTRDRGELVRICLNTHGTRVVQKLIESLKTKKQISLVIRALEPAFLDLIKDLNGNHVVQRCLQCLSNEDNKFIFDAAARFSVEIATHRHGCCVLQRCIAHSNGEHRKKLVDEICTNGLVLAQDPFGNYVVQYIIELKIPSAAAQLSSQFEGHYVHLAMQKFSSHVVEKCLKHIEESHARIVYELLSVSHFEQLLQDPFANYVVQSALEVTKGTLNDSLVTAVRPHSILRTNPYCKKIFTRGLLKK